MSTPGVQHTLDQFNRSLREYTQLSGKTPEEVLTKQGGKLAFALAQRLRSISPAKGQVRQERLAKLKAGEGVRVRPSIEKAIMEKYGARQEIATKELVFGKKGVRSVRRKGGKRLNLRALMVQRELNTRERGRGFLSVSARYPRVLVAEQYAKSAFGPVLSDAGLSNNGETLTFRWNPAMNQLQASAAQGMSRDKARSAIAYALRDTSEDIRTYINRKRKDDGQRSGLKVT